MPATDLLNLQVLNNGRPQEVQLSLRDLSGKLVTSGRTLLQQGAGDCFIAVETVPAGSYILTLTGAEGVVATRLVTIR